ncbi:hypothetical protein [Aporhodopirellula aestuarii]|uniref:Uncharacterized protein n=1 Tax=Aporhodopirellula aestuarii TaxID=2950107 RepID=A0ABT0TYH3_9BACT|nr:hypothetical protein [Aporhodopirellula aestuarii]MCM2369643.1 hypothetical protein [Aporhodopirellula aestuarii]
MKSFKDNQGQSWTLSLTLAKVRQCRTKLGLDLLNPQHYMQVLHSLTDRLTFCFLLCEEQAKDLKLSVDEFEERLYGEGISQGAGDAFLSECEHFFCRLGQTTQAELTRKSLESMIASRQNLSEMQKTGQLDSLFTEAEEAIQKLLQPSDGAGSQS